MNIFLINNLLNLSLGLFSASILIFISAIIYRYSKWYKLNKNRRQLQSTKKILHCIGRFCIALFSAALVLFAISYYLSKYYLFDLFSPFLFIIGSSIFFGNLSYVASIGVNKADLRRADFRRADFRRADLRGADFRRADLRGADLRGADFRGADLRGADFRGVDQAQYFTENLGNGVFLDMVAIPGGTFMMGSPLGEGRDNEKPQHEVTVQPFLMGKYPITQAQYQEVMGKNPSYFQGNDRPVECVSWNDAVEFCQRLSQQTGAEYRLPTEAEWEYACRAGTTTPYHFGETITDKLANYGRNVGETTSVGQFPPNAFGLYDMHGNVWEWCQDDWHDSYKNAPNDSSAWVSAIDRIKVIRGGSWYINPDNCRSATRYYNTRDNRNDIIGFRVVCVVPRTT